MNLDICDPDTRLKMEEFNAILTSLAWRIAGRVIAEQRAKLAKELTSLHIKASKSNRPAGGPTYRQKMAVLESQTGTWSRGGGSYKVLGLGTKPGTHRLKNVSTGKEIDVVTKTLLARWKPTL